MASSPGERICGISAELARLQEGIDLLARLRRVFLEMSDAGERDRAWGYLSDRFGEFEKAEMPAWENELEAVDA